MKNEPGVACINNQLPCTAMSEQIEVKEITQVLHVKSFKDITSEERKKEASKPIYLVRYE
jgi:hypothetical protein